MFLDEEAEVTSNCTPLKDAKVELDSLSYYTIKYNLKIKLKMSLIIKRVSTFVNMLIKDLSQANVVDTFSYVFRNLFP